MGEADRPRWSLQSNCWPSRAQAYPKTSGEDQVFEERREIMSDFSGGSTVTDAQAGSELGEHLRLRRSLYSKGSGLRLWWPKGQADRSDPEFSNQGDYKNSRTSDENNNNKNIKNNNWLGRNHTSSFSLGLHKACSPREEASRHQWLPPAPIWATVVDWPAAHFTQSILHNLAGMEIRSGYLLA